MVGLEGLSFFNLLVFVCNKIMMMMMMTIAQWKGTDVKIIRNLLATGVTYFRI